MKYVSLDIETTGLNPVVHDVVEIGAVIDDLTVQAPLDTLPSFHCYVVKKNYTTDAYCAFLHQAMFSRISRMEELADQYNFLYESEVMPALVAWLVENGFGKTTGRMHNDGSPETTEKPKFTAAGKNFGSFDLQFLNHKFGFERYVRCRHRALDPAILYFDPTMDTELPNMQKCLDRAGIEETVDHTGLADALSVVKLLRHKFPKEG